jgi:hypothetical protein
MSCSKPRFASPNDSRAKPCPRRFCPQIEQLEDRFQPSLIPFPLGSFQAYPVAGYEPLPSVDLTPIVHEIHPLFVLNTATYITGTTGSATAQGIAVGPDGSTFETGTISLGGRQEAYLAKYDVSGRQVYFDPFQLKDTNNALLNTMGSAVAVDDTGNAYVAGTIVNSSFVDQAFAVKISGDGTKMVWVGRLLGPSTAAGIAVSDPNHNGQGQAVVTGTLTINNVSVGPLGDHVLVARLTADGMALDYEIYFSLGNSDGGSHGEAVALNNNSSASTPGSLAYVAGNIILNGSQQFLALQFDNSTGTTAGNLIWARTLSNTTPAPNTDTLTGVAVKADDSSVYSGVANATSGTVGFVVGYPPDGGPVSQLPPILTQLQTRARSLNAVAVDSAGSIYVTGAAANPSPQGGVYVAELDSQGHFLSDLQFGDSGTVDAGYGIAVTSSGPLWLVGDTTSPSFSTDGTTLNGTQDGWLASVSNS